MATNAENLDSAISNICLLLKTVTSPESGKPSYSIDGESVSWESYAAMLVKLLGDIRKERQTIQSPFSLKSRGRSA